MLRITWRRAPCPTKRRMVTASDSSVTELLVKLRKWRACEEAAKADVADAAHHVAAMKDRLEHANYRLKQVQSWREDVEADLAETIVALTTPPEMAYASDERWPMDRTCDDE